MLGRPRRLLPGGRHIPIVTVRPRVPPGLFPGDWALLLHACQGNLPGVHLAQAGLWVPGKL